MNATAPQQQKAAPTQQSNASKPLIEQVLEAASEYVPFMAKESIKLSANLVMTHLCKPTKSGKLCSKKDAERFIMLCKARGLDPWEGDAFVVGYDSTDGPEFNLITSHQAFLKRAEVHPEFDGMESGVTVRDKDKNLHDIQGDFVEDGLVLVAGWARVIFKNRKIPVYRRLKLATFNKGYSRWKIDPAGMIVKCAEADALRSAFPNSLGGMYLADEFPSDAGPRDPVELPQDLASKLKARAASVQPNGNGSHAPNPAPASEAFDPAAEPANDSGSSNSSPEPDLDNQAAEAEAAERLGRANQLLADIPLARKTWELQLSKHYAGKKWEALTADEQEAEIKRMTAMVPVNA